MACWLFASQRDGISALALKRALEIGSYQTAWAMLHLLRSVLVRPGRERLRGEVEVDETYIGGEEPGLRGGRQKGKKVLVGVAVERREPKGFGRCRMVPIPDASAESLRSFLLENVEPGATVITDGWQSSTRPRPRTSMSTGRSRAPPVKTRRSCCPACTRCPRWPSAGCSAPTKARSMRRTWPTTSTSSSSASTVVARAAAAWSSTAYSSSPLSTIPCATASSSTTPSLADAVHSRPAGAAGRPALSDPERAGLGGRARATPPKWIPHYQPFWPMPDRAPRT